MTLKELTYREPENLFDLADMLFKNGDFDGARFIEEELNDWDSEIRYLEREREKLDRYSDEVIYGMTQIKNSIEDLEKKIMQSSRINRKEILTDLALIKMDFDEYI